MLLGFRALESSLKITNLMVVPRLSLWAFSSSLHGKSVGAAQMGPGASQIQMAYQTQLARHLSLPDTVRHGHRVLSDATGGHSPNAQHVVVE